MIDSVLFAKLFIGTLQESIDALSVYNDSHLVGGLLVWVQVLQPASSEKVRVPLFRSKPHFTTVAQ
jgi:hypothetical protein